MKQASDKQQAVLTVGRLLILFLMILLTSCGSGPATATPTSPLPSPTAPPEPTPTHPPTPPLPSEPGISLTPHPAEPTATSHQVQAGDTLLDLARQYGVPMAAIQLQNGMGDSTTLYAGDMLLIPPPIGWEGASLYWIVYVVKAGDTLNGIGQRYGLSIEALQAANRLSDPGRLQVGQELVLPLDRPAVVQPPPTERPASSPAPTTAAANPPPAEIAAWPGEVVRLINEVRAAHGLEPLVYNEALAQAAQAQANDCAGRGWCSHTGSDGSTAKTRIQRAGYAGAGWAECWAQSLNPQHAVDMWMDEVPPNDPHRRTLLSTWLREVGVGVAETGWGYYFIADFGRP